MDGERLATLSQSLNEEAPGEQLPAAEMMIFIAVTYLLMILVGMFVFAYSFTRQRNYIFANSNLDQQINFASSLRARDMAWILISNLLLIIFTLGLALPWTKVRMARYLMENTHANTEAGFEHYITQAQEAQSALGEQIGDAFDVDVGIGI